MVAPLIATIPEALRHWKRVDPRLHAVARKHPPEGFALSRGSSYSTLVASILSQQVSVKAADAMYRKLELACGGRVRPELVAGLSDEALRACGFSTQKRVYVRDLSERALDGRLNFRRFPRLPDEEVIDALTEVKGVGRWTAQMFLLFHLARPDVVAPDDLGLQLSAVEIYGLADAKAGKRFLALQAPVWSPHGSLACLTLWHYRRLRLNGQRAVPAQ
ncbi:MAG TPA: DNA-3-methyladenine glycosylase 2 family protein [Candidatus Thermoplasmatota archaeon]|nr:DNA-3-methyladenine glycosylase 2 family protein [Candidatus Thermoplasmatota archaeon]